MSIKFPAVPKAEYDRVLIFGDFNIHVFGFTADFVNLFESLNLKYNSLVRLECFHLILLYTSTLLLFQRKILYSVIHCIYLTAIVTCHFSNEDCLLM